MDLALGPVVELGTRHLHCTAGRRRRADALPGKSILYSRGEATGTFEAPLTGECLVRAESVGNAHGDGAPASRPGHDDGEVQAVDVTGTRAEPQDL